MASRTLAPALSRAAATATSRQIPRGSLAAATRTVHTIQPIQPQRRLRPRHPGATATCFFSSSARTRKQDSNQAEATIQPSILYNFADIQEFSSAPSPDRILIDVREPHELLENGTIPSAHNVPISTSPDAFFVSADEFEDKFGFERPTEEQEVVFFCKAGVRSKAAARLAQQAGFGGKTGEYPGSWMDWVASGGKIQKV